MKDDVRKKYFIFIYECNGKFTYVIFQYIKIILCEYMTWENTNQKVYNDLVSDVPFKTIPITDMWTRL